MDNPIFLLLFIGGAIALFLFLLLKYGGDKKPEYTSIENRIRDIDDNRVSESGLKLKIEDGANITAPEIAAIETGLNRCFAKAQAIGYNHPVKLSDYTVIILGDCMRAPESGTWCYKLPANNYAGTSFDLGGYILANAQFLNDPNSNTIILPDYQGTDLELLSDIAGFEVEHAVLRASDFPRFVETITHGVGDGHPLF